MLKSIVNQFVYSLIFYVVLIFLAIQEPIQTALVYLNWINLPRPMYLKTPQLLNLSIAKVHNFYIPTSENLELGAWHILPTKIYEKEIKIIKENNVSDIDSFGKDFYTQQIKSSTDNIVLYFHGSAGNRGSSRRFPTYEVFTSQLDSHLIAIDYRGFGDSTGTPSENGLYEDSLAAWNWLLELGINPNRITICGHSLGTGVSIRLVNYLNEREIFPKSLILSAAYTSIIDAMFDYRFFSTIPLFYPLKSIPNYKSYTLYFLNHRFDSINQISKIRTPTLFFHGVKDFDVRIKSSWLLYNATLEKDIEESDSPFTTNVLSGVGQQIMYRPKSQGASNRLSKISSLVIVDHASHNNLPEFPIFSVAIAELWALIKLNQNMPVFD